MARSSIKRWCGDKILSLRIDTRSNRLSGFSVDAITGFPVSTIHVSMDASICVDTDALSVAIDIDPSNQSMSHLSVSIDALPSEYRLTDCDASIDVSIHRRVQNQSSTIDIDSINCGIEVDTQHSQYQSSIDCRYIDCISTRLHLYRLRRGKKH